MECTPEANLKLPFVLAKTLGPVLGACNLALLWGLIWSAPARLKEAMARAGYLKGEDQTEKVYGAIMDHPEGIWLGRLDPEKNLEFIATGIWSGLRGKIRWGECKYIDSGRPSGQNRRHSPSPPGPRSVRENTKLAPIIFLYDRAVASDLPEPRKQDFDKLYAVDHVLEGETHIDIVEGRNVREHWHGEMPRPGHGVDVNPGLPYREVHGL